MHYREGSAYLAFEHQARRRDPMQPILLNEHYRCQPEIARWFNREFYDNQLTVLTDLTHRIGRGSAPTQRQAAVLWKDIEGRSTRGQQGSWANREEAIQAGAGGHQVYITREPVSGDSHTFQGTGTTLHADR